MFSGVTLLLLLCSVFPVWFAYRRSVSHLGVEVNHVTLFTFGFLFYWVLPIAVGQIASTFAGDMWSDLFGTASFASKYLLAALVSYAAFAAGDLIACRMLRPVFRQPTKLSETGLMICLAPAIPLAVITVYAYRDLLFETYGRDIPAERARGTVSAFVILFGVIALLYICDHSKRKIRQLVTSSFVLPFIAGSIFMLLLASRIYVVSFVLIFVVFGSCFLRRFQMKSLVLGTIFVAAASGIIGALRVGLTIADGAANLILEPMMTSFSLIYFLRYEPIAWIHFPKYLISDFINLIPTALFPGKADLMEFPFVYQPGGATHSFVSFNYNFGLIGTFVFMFVLPIGLRWLRMRGSLQLARVSYSMVSGFLAFTFFRDPFSVSLVKGMLQFSILLPSFIVLFNRLIQAAAPHETMKAGPQQMIGSQNAG